MKWLLVALGGLAVGGCKGGATAPIPVPETFPTSTTGPTLYTGELCDQNHSAWTVGLLHCTPEASPGYTLFAPMNSRTTYLIDIHGQWVHTWESDYLPGESAYLEADGHLLRTAEDNLESTFRNGGAGGRIQEFDWDGQLVWEFVYNGADHLLHHDVERLPSGNVLAIAWESITKTQAVDLGRDPTSVTDEDGMWAVHLIEVEPASNDIVWEWHVLDHVVQDLDSSAANYGVLADNPGRVDINRTWGAFGGSEADWNHVNGIDYNAALDQIVLSAHNQDEIWIIDHGAVDPSGPEGELVYRWGSPDNYGVDRTQLLSGQHDVEWIPQGHPGAGNLLVFNNGNAFGFSSVVEIETPVQPDGSYQRDVDGAYGPTDGLWVYSDPPGFFSSFISGSQRLPNGNTLICEGDGGRFFEVTPAGAIVWEYINPVGPIGPVEQGATFQGGGLLNSAFRADRYPPDFPAFTNRDLTPQGTIQL